MTFCLTLGAPFESGLQKYSSQTCTPGFRVTERIGGIEERHQSEHTIPVAIPVAGTRLPGNVE